MRASMAYLAGAGTVLVAVSIGVGGGFVMADIMNPHQSRDSSRVEQRHATQQAERSAQPSQSQPPQSNGAANASQTSQTSGAYLAATQQAATTPVVIAPASSSASQPKTEQPKTEQLRPETNSAPPPAESAVVSAAAKAEKTEKVDKSEGEKAASSDSASKPNLRPAAREQGSTLENAYATARETDIRRAADEKHRADRAERRQQRAARRQQQRELELRDVEAQVREDTTPQRNIIVRGDDRQNDSWRDDSDRPVRMEVPRFNLFDQD
jgi:hypothetical protein